MRKNHFAHEEKKISSKNSKGKKGYLKNASAAGNSIFRFYLELRKDPHGPDVALFIGNLPANLSQKQYETILLEFLDESK